MHTLNIILEGFWGPFTDFYVTIGIISSTPVQ